MRIILRLLARLFALVLAGVGVLMALEAGSALVQPAAGPLLVPWPQWRDVVASYTWADVEVLVGAGVLVGIGLLLLLLVRLARRREVGLIGPAEGVRAVTSPRSLARAVGHRVREQDGVGSASVTATGRRVRVRASSALRPENQLRSAVADSVRELLTELPLARKPRVRVVVDSWRSRP